MLQLGSNHSRITRLSLSSTPIVKHFHNVTIYDDTVGDEKASKRIKDIVNVLRIFMEI